MALFYQEIRFLHTKTRPVLGRFRAHIGSVLCIHCKNSVFGGFSLKDYIEERAVKIASYIIETRATVRQAAKKFGISKSTVHIDVTKEVFL